MENTQQELLAAAQSVALRQEGSTFGSAVKRLLTDNAACASPSQSALRVARAINNFQET